MHRFRSGRTVVLAFLCLCIAVITASCDSNGNEMVEPDACGLSDTRECSTDDGCRGTRVCQGNPPAWSACRCEAPEPSPDDAGRKPTIGGACEDDGDCASPAFCLGPESLELFGGGAPEGTCVGRCDDSTEPCGDFENAVCVQVADTDDQESSSTSRDTALCLERCTVGGGPASECHAREQVACASLEAEGSAGFCRPLCSTDDDCPIACDPKHGVCTDTPVVDADFALRCTPPLGAYDDSDGGTDQADAGTCAGVCVKVNDSPSICTRACSFGDASECGPATFGQRRGGCLFAEAEGSFGDLGYCAELCDCSTDCIEPTFVCDAFDDQDLEAAFERKGVCIDPMLVVNRVLECER
jgi:hypothetical protein